MNKEYFYINENGLLSEVDKNTYVKWKNYTCKKATIHKEEEKEKIYKNNNN